MAVSREPVRYIPALTGLRALAAYLVFLHHYNPAASGTFIHRLFDQGYVGVAIFFMLSGFLLYHRYADAYFSQKNWSWRNYLLNRFARIYPLYVLLLVLTIGVNAWWGQPMSWTLAMLNLTLLKGLFDAYKFSGIAQSWSLTVEVCFYLTAPFLFLMVRRWGSGWLTAGLAGLGVCLWVTVGQLAWHGFFGTLPFVFFYTFFGRGSEFVAGMWLARRYHQSRLPAVKHPIGVGLFVMAGCMGWQASSAFGQGGMALPVLSEVLAYNLILPVGIGLLLLGLITQSSGISRLLSHPFAQALGEGSYAFYLIHSGVIARGLQKAGITNYGLLFVLLVALSHVLYHLIEKPLQQQLRTISEPPRPRLKKSV